MRVNQSKFAQLLCKSDQYVALLVQQGLPAERSGRRGPQVFIETGPAIDWLLSREFQKGQADVGPAGSLDGETRRLRGAQADLAELEAAERRGSLVPLEDVQIALNEYTVIIATQMDGQTG